jgi:hypothetical protein
MGLASPPRNLDPRTATDATSERINRLLYRRLIEFNEESLPVPSLARWERLTPAVAERSTPWHSGGRLALPTLTLAVDFPLPAFRQPGRLRRLRRSRQRRDVYSARGGTQ